MGKSCSLWIPGKDPRTQIRGKRVSWKRLKGLVGFIELHSPDGRMVCAVFDPTCSGLILVVATWAMHNSADTAFRGLNRLQPGCEPHPEKAHWRSHLSGLPLFSDAPHIYQGIAPLPSLSNCKRKWCPVTTCTHGRRSVCTRVCQDKSHILQIIREMT